MIAERLAARAIFLLMYSKCQRRFGVRTRFIVAGVVLVIAPTPVLAACTANSIPTTAMPSAATSCSKNVIEATIKCNDGISARLDTKACAWVWSNVPEPKPRGLPPGLTAEDLGRKPEVDTSSISNEAGLPGWMNVPPPKDLPADCKVARTRIQCADGSSALLDLNSRKWEWSGSGNPRVGNELSVLPAANARTASMPSAKAVRATWVNQAMLRGLDSAKFDVAGVHIGMTADKASSAVRSLGYKINYESAPSPFPGNLRIIVPGKISASKDGQGVTISTYPFRGVLLVGNVSYRRNSGDLSENQCLELLSRKYANLASVIMLGGGVDAYDARDVINIRSSPEGGPRRNTRFPALSIENCRRGIVQIELSDNGVYAKAFAMEQESRSVEDLSL